MKAIIVLFILTFMACSSEPDPKFDFQGHRGARGLLPENTIPAFIKALDLGVSTLELDLAVTKDHQLIVSHEPLMSFEICLDSSGSPITEKSQYDYNIYQMNEDEIRLFDCGTLAHPRFPEQKQLNVSKPLLSDVFDTVAVHTTVHGYPLVNYNIEIKSSRLTDNIYHPVPAVFCELVYNAVGSKVEWSRVTIQSFDFRVLEYFHDRYPEIQLALLIENDLSWQENIDSLGFNPNIYSCYYPFLNGTVVDQLHTKGIRVIPWTVNERAEMKRLIRMGVDGLISDYPDRYHQLF